MEELLPQNYSVDDLAKILKIHPVSVRKKIKQGKIRAFRIGRKWLISQEEYQRLSQKNT